jgi:hypothetical protein
MAFVIANLTTHGVKIALPISEHLPFDLIAISDEGQLAKVSVKYRSARDGKIEVLLRSKWNAAQGTRQRRWQKGEVDVHAIYCPDTQTCYYVPDAKVRKATITLRLTPPSVMRVDTMMAQNFTDPEVMFA